MKLQSLISLDKKVKMFNLFNIVLMIKVMFLELKSKKIQLMLPILTLKKDFSLINSKIVL